MLIYPVCERVFPDGAAERCPYDESPLYVIGDDVGARSKLGPGDIVAGKYELIEEIEDRTGVGRTFRARQVNLERAVELRILPENTITKPSDHARFRREVETWGKLRSDNLIRLYDSGFTDGHAPYMALEYVNGGSLGDRLRKSGSISIEMGKALAGQVLRAMEMAHGANVLHRDVSPDAVMMELRANGKHHFRLTGFGLAKHLGDEDDDPTAITMTGQVVGNPAYMAPETIMQGVLDQRTDLYALGVTIYEAVTGQRPFPGRSLADMLAAHIQGQPALISRYQTSSPPAFTEFVSRMIHREPEHRFQNASEALAALESDGRHQNDGMTPPVAPGTKPDRSEDWPIYFLSAGIIILALFLLWE